MLLGNFELLQPHHLYMRIKPTPLNLRCTSSLHPFLSCVQISRKENSLASADAVLLGSWKTITIRT